MAREKTKLRESARGQDCTLNVVDICNYNPEKVVLCHLDSEDKGYSLKSHDTFAVYGCSDCHAWLDQHHGSQLERFYYTLRALNRTYRKMIDNGDLVIK